MKLNVGAGNRPREGWTNLDIIPNPDIDIVADVQETVPGGPYTQIQMHHLIEHLPKPLDAMQNLYDAAAPDCQLEIVCPHGASDEAWEDQTHLRPYYPRSFLAFAQPYYLYANYGYTADWQTTHIFIEVWDRFRGPEVATSLNHLRNVARNLTIILQAIKPARPTTEPLSFPTPTIHYISKETT